MAHPDTRDPAKVVLAPTTSATVYAPPASAAIAAGATVGQALTGTVTLSPGGPGARRATISVTVNGKVVTVDAVEAVDPNQFTAAGHFTV